MRWFSRTASLLLLSSLRCAARFTTSFDNVLDGSSLPLTWDAVEEQYLPMYITAKVFDVGSDGHTANAYKVNITTSVTGTNFTWRGLPYPLNYIPTGKYALELWPSTWEGAIQPVLAKSPFFEISSQPSNPTGPVLPVTSPSLAEFPGTESRVNRTLAIALGVAIGVPSVLALTVVSWCFRKRQTVAARERREEKRRMRRREFIID